MFRGHLAQVFKTIIIFFQQENIKLITQMLLNEAA